MTEINKLSKSLPDMTEDISIDVEGAVTRTRWQGDFSYTIPNGKQRAMAAKKTAQLNGPNAQDLSPTVRDFHSMLGYLHATLSKSPDWWKSADYGYALFDSNVVSEVYNRAVEFEEAWMAKVWPDAKKEPEKDAEVDG